MLVVVVVESLYGNTRRVAEAVAEGAATAAEVVLVPLAETAGAPPAADLVVAGCPTHVHGMSSARTRRGAVQDAAKHGLPAPLVTGPPLRDWLERTGRPLAPRGAAFDTRAAKPAMLTGSAARGIARRMRRMGYVVAGEESFVVEGTDGPLREGELERARAWGASLVGAPVGAGVQAAAAADHG